jgi:hypothetical protein
MGVEAILMTVVIQDRETTWLQPPSYQMSLNLSRAGLANVLG